LEVAIFVLFSNSFPRKFLKIFITMRRIKFDNLQNNWVLIILTLLSFLCVIFGLFEIYKFENPKINKGILLLGFLSNVVYFSRMLWFKNYVLWNAKGIVLRLKPSKGKSIPFNEIKGLQYQDSILTISRNNGVDYNFDLTDIDERDTTKLIWIIKKYSFQ
jgi:hypothetical protein